MGLAGDASPFGTAATHPPPLGNATTHGAYVAHAAGERLVNSGDYTGLPADEGGRRIVADLAARAVGRAAVTYRLRDWLISRQR